MRITSKGQVTIPQEIREKAGLLPGTEVEFRYRRGQVVLSPLAAKPGEGRNSAARLALENARGTGNEPMFRGWTTDQIMAFLRGED
jgi:AbrB family looped-hinge helix DNA binding protein